MSAGPIPWTAVQRYAEVEGMSVDETWILHAVIRHLDRVMTGHVAETQKSAAKKASPRHGTPSRGRQRG